jgi:hypothetical protein
MSGNYRYGHATCQEETTGNAGVCQIPSGHTPACAIVENLVEGRISAGLSLRNSRYQKLVLMEMNSLYIEAYP